MELTELQEKCKTILSGEFDDHIAESMTIEELAKQVYSNEWDLGNQEEMKEELKTTMRKRNDVFVSQIIQNKTFWMNKLVLNSNLSLKGFSFKSLKK